MITLTLGQIILITLTVILTGFIFGGYVWENFLEGHYKDLLK